MKTCGVWDKALPVQNGYPSPLERGHCPWRVLGPYDSFIVQCVGEIVERETFEISHFFWKSALLLHGVFSS
jgi:hypothetical protein